MPNAPRRHRSTTSPVPNHDARPTSTARGYDRNWRKTRLAYLQTQPLCEACLRWGRVTPAYDVDHVTPLSMGGARLDFDNLRALCRRCHNKKTHGRGGETGKPEK